MTPDGPRRRLFRLGIRRPSPEDSAAWEAQHHLVELEDRLTEKGWDPRTAHAEALRRFGDPAHHAHTMVAIDQKGMMMRKVIELASAWRAPLRQFVRTTRRAPGYVVGVVLTLALGIGANGAMFQILDRLLLSPPRHIEEPESVRRLFLKQNFRGRESLTSILTYSDLADLRSIDEFVAVGGFSSGSSLIVDSGSGTAPVWAVFASHDLFDVLRTQPHRGRFFGQDEDRVGRPLTAVLGYEYWIRALGEDSDAIGRMIDIAGTPYEIIGIAPEGFTGVGLRAVDLWLPMVPAQVQISGSTDFITHRWLRTLTTIVRIKDGASLAAAESQASALHRNGREEQIAEGRYDGEARIFAAPLIAAHGPRPSDRSRVAMWLAGVSLVVLLIACANVANLLLARGAQRQREIAVRLALGSSRRRLVGEVILESVLLALAGGLAALVFAEWGGDLVRRTLMPQVLWVESGFGFRTVLIIAALSLLAGLVAGVGPALQSTRCDLAQDLRSRGRGNSGHRSFSRTVLAIAQTALATLLLVGAGLFVKSLTQVRDLDMGIDVDRVAMVRLELDQRERSALDNTALYQSALERAVAHPLVESAALSMVPFDWAFSEGGISVPGLDSIPRLDGGGPYYYKNGPNYLATLGLEVTRGRALREADGEGFAVAVVSETMAETLWPAEDPLGRCFRRGDSDLCTTVVGVVENATKGSIEQPPFMAYYLPLTADDEPKAIYIRTVGDAEAATAPLASLLRQASPEIRYATVLGLRGLLDPQTRSWALGATMFSIFGLLALAVASIGLYSLLAFQVTSRTREIGIRLALGAPQGRVLSGVVFGGVRLTVIGVTIGLVVAALAGPSVRDLLFRVEGRDTAVFLGVALTLMTASVVASAVPGLRATRVDPREALASE